MYLEVNKEWLKDNWDKFDREANDEMSNGEDLLLIKTEGDAKLQWYDKDTFQLMERIWSGSEDKYKFYVSLKKKMDFDFKLDILENLKKTMNKIKTMMEALK